MPANAVQQLANLPTAFDKVYRNGTLIAAPIIAARQATTDASGNFSVTFSTEGFSSAVAPMCQAQAISTATGVANLVTATTTAPTYASGAWTVTGTVAISQAIAVLGGLPLKAVGNGIVVNVQAVGS